MCGIVMAVSSIVILAAARAHRGRVHDRPRACASSPSGSCSSSRCSRFRTGCRSATAGALRGFKDANVPMALNFAAYWLIGFPAAWWFGIRQGFGPSGIWAGLIAGLVTCAVFLLLRYRHVTRVRGAASPERSGREFQGILGIPGQGPDGISARLAGSDTAPAAIATARQPPSSLEAASQARRSAAGANPLAAGEAVARAHGRPLPRALRGSAEASRWRRFVPWGAI